MSQCYFSPVTVQFAYLSDSFTVGIRVHTNTRITGITGITSEYRKIQYTTYAKTYESHVKQIKT